MTHRIAVIPGDGIGVEVIREASRLLELLSARCALDLSLWHLDLGAERYLRDGTTLPPALFDEIRDTCSAILMGAVGDPRVPSNQHAIDILFGFRFGLDLFANIRPVRCLDDRLSPLKHFGAKAIDFVIFRENTEGLYVNVGGQVRRGTPDEIAINEDVNTRKGVERIVRAAFAYARERGLRRVHMADKSNAMRHAHELWLRVFREVAGEYGDIEAVHAYVDALAMYMVQDPSQMQVIVTCNLFGDILTDIGAALQGGLGLAASASVHAPGRIALFEPVHGSAPPLAGKDLANPFASFLTVGLMMRHLGHPALDTLIEEAVRECLQARECTRDVGGPLGTRAASEACLARVARALD
jgi:3-isopropylmalate dehydrogenase